MTPPFSIEKTHWLTVIFTPDDQHILTGSNIVKGCAARDSFQVKMDTVIRPVFEEISPATPTERHKICNYNIRYYNGPNDNANTGNRSWTIRKDKVFEMAEGRVWSGSQAVENGLADANGTLHDAIIKAKDMADLGDKFTLYEMKTPLTPFEAWLDAMGMMTAKACGIDYNIYGDELKEVIKNNVELFTNNGVLMAMPQNIEVNF